ncbi:MAG: hypothetical protein AVDCRST_MAG76-3319 [uncultured Acidimicrobiales bacterium]|uniref:Uncharacterized protein n=1 Tax=uncultured Acidimicrobiales bacterium TaxID=310071 RepID=A0A6J4J7I9_9ACTN|nr:MAG: hypothetical protein AVDCRST_MAG76-3319 [uncultured Acidimicrobiales bacterium]
MAGLKLISRTRRSSAVVGTALLVMGAVGGYLATRAEADTPAASILTLQGVSTSVDLDAGTAAVLKENGVTVTPVTPATVSTAGGTTTASFPITEGYVAVYPQDQQPFVRGAFSHSGGLTFSAGGKSLTATDFVVNPGTSTLTATVGGNGVQLLDLDGTNVKITQDGNTTRLEGTVAKLSATAAQALNQTFGVSLFKQGIPLGVVRIAAQGPAGPGGEPSAEIQELGGRSTSVDLDPATATVLKENNVTVTPVAPATVSTTGGTTTVSFPITQGYVSVYPESQQPFIRGTFSHVGGLTFRAGGKSLTATDFIVNPGSSELIATVGGNAVQLLDLDGTNVKVTPDGSTTRIEGTVAKLSSAAAQALNQTFGVSLFQQGIPLGVVRIAATPGPPPAIVSSGTSEQGTTTTQPAAGTAQAPAGGVATGGGGTASRGAPSGALLPAGILAVLALLLAGGGLWRYRPQTQRGADT